MTENKKEYSENDDGQMLLCGESDGETRDRLKSDYRKSVLSMIDKLTADKSINALVQLEALSKFAEALQWLGNSSEHIGDIHYNRNQQVSRGTQKLIMKAKSIKEVFDDKGKKRIEVFSNLKTFFDARIKDVKND